MPKIFHVNWFRTDEDGKFLWPGYGENIRVLRWIIDRCRGRGEAAETPIGHVPTAAALDTSGLEVSAAQVKALLNVDADAWRKEAEDLTGFFKKVGSTLPHELEQERQALLSRLEKPIKVSRRIAAKK